MTNIHKISAEKALESMKQGIALIDIREEGEQHATGIAKGAVTIPLSTDNFVEAIAKRTKEKKETPLIIVCAAGGRSAKVCHYLAELGYQTLYDLAEGMTGGPFGQGWIAKNLPMEESRN